MVISNKFVQNIYKMLPVELVVELVVELSFVVVFEAVLLSDVVELFVVVALLDVELELPEFP